MGVVPAAGAARRLGPLPCSKEIYPIGVRPTTRGSVSPVRATVACDYLLEDMREAGADAVLVALGHGKWDIASYLGDGADVGLRIAYVPVRDSPGVPHSVGHVLPLARGARIVFGFPDIVFRPAGALAALLERQSSTGADVVLGLFPAHRPDKVDMVETDADARVRRIVIKPSRTHLRETWLLAVWTERFSTYLCEHLQQAPTPRRGAPETYMGDVIHAVVEAGWYVDSVVFPQGTYRDIGTVDGLIDAAERFGDGAGRGLPSDVVTSE